MSNITAVANSNKAKVSINGNSYVQETATTQVGYGKLLQLELPVVVKAENGYELEYTLVIYKESRALGLEIESIVVDEIVAKRISEGTYSSVIARDKTNANVTVNAITELVNVSINNSTASAKTKTENVKTEKEITEVPVRLTVMVEGEEVYKDYVLNIYKTANGRIEFVIVNGTVVSADTEGIYNTYLPSEVENAKVEVITLDSKDEIEIIDGETSKGTGVGNVNAEVDTPNNKNEYTIKVTNDQGSEIVSENYKLYISKPSVDASLRLIEVQNGEYKVKAEKSLTEKNVYEAKVKDFSEYQIIAETNQISALVGIDGNTLVPNKDTKQISKTAEDMEFIINAESENGDKVEYKLKIHIMSKDNSLEYIKISSTDGTNEIETVKQADGSYLANLDTAELEVNVEAKAVSNVAEVKIEEGLYSKEIGKGAVRITAKDTETYVTIKAEDGEEAKYKLIISGLPDDATLASVKVNGENAKYIEGENKYEIRKDAESFNIEAVSTDSLAKMKLTYNENVGEGTGTALLENITKIEETTVINMKVTAQNGVDSENYTLEIKEKSNDSSIGQVTVNGEEALKTEERKL